MGVPKDWQAKLELEDSIDSAKMQRAEPLPPPQILTFLLVALNGDTKSRIINQLPLFQYQLIISPTVDLALDLLEKVDFVDLVLSNVSSKDDDNGYNFIAVVQRMRKNIPHVVIFEAEGLGDPEIIRAKQLGACHILWKPVSEPSNVIKYLRQHVLRRRAQNEGSSSSKKPRMVWHKALDDLFVKAVNELGDGVTSKGIIEVMNKNGDLDVLTRGQVLSRKHVESHLQRYREKEKNKQEHQAHVVYQQRCLRAANTT